MPGDAGHNFTQKDGVTLKEHFESRLSAIEKSMAVATEALERRLEGMNEFRSAMGDLSNRMVTRSEMDICMERIKIDIDDLKKSRDIAQGKASQTQVLIAMAFSLIGIVMGVVSLLR